MDSNNLEAIIFLIFDISKSYEGLCSTDGALVWTTAGLGAALGYSTTLGVSNYSTFAGST